MALDASADELPPKRFRVADLVVDVGQVAITRGGERIALSGLSFDLLVALARAAPDVVSPDELMKRVWAGVIVSPETVSQRVKLLRDALGDDAREPRYVAGVRGRGYRLIAAVEPLLEDAVPGPPPAAPTDAPAEESAVGAVELPAAAGPPRFPAAARRAWPYLAAAVALVALVALVAAVWSARPARVVASPTAPTAASDAPTRVDAAGLATRTIAVLPFQNLSDDPANNFIGLGVAEMVLNRLAGSDELFVVARSSSFAFEARNVDAREIGRQLGARFLVQGSVQRAADVLRVTAQVVDAESGKQLRALTFDRPLRDLFAVQDDIATQVATALDVTVGAVASGTTDIDAHLEYLRGLEALGRYRVPEAEKAIGHFRRAQELDPVYGAPYAAEARARLQIVALTGGDVAPLKPEIRPLADRAVELAPELGPAYVARGILQTSPEAAERDLRHGIALAPSFAEGYLQLSQLIAPQPGRSAEASALLEQAILVDPLAPRPRYVQALEQFHADGDVDAVARRLEEVLRLDPSYTQALTRLTTVLVFRDNRLADAIAVIERSMAADPRSFVARARALELYVRIGDHAAAEELAEALPRDSAPWIALAYARGDARLAAERARAPRPNARSARTLVSTIGELDLASVLALADEALVTRQYDRARAVLRERHCAPPESPDGVECMHPATMLTAFVLIQLDLASGERARAERDARTALAFVEGSASRLPPGIRNVMRSRALLLAGRPDDALAALQATNETPSRVPPLWLLEHDRMFDPLRDRPAFQAILAAQRAAVVRERARLERLREAGTVPRRPARIAVAKS